MWWVLLLAGCLVEKDVYGEDDEDGGCEDGVDNDVDGVMDCEDEDCASSRVCGTGTTSTSITDGDCPPYIISFETPLCQDELWTYRATVQCHPRAVELAIMQTGVDPSVAWDELHPLTALDVAPAFEVWGADLPVVRTVGEVVEGETSVFACEDREPGRSATMTWAIRTYDADGLADCYAYGDDPSFFEGCRDGGW